MKNIVIFNYALGHEFQAIMKAPGYDSILKKAGIFATATGSNKYTIKHNQSGAFQALPEITISGKNGISIKGINSLDFNLFSRGEI